jgi:hypothetical protein
MKPEPGMEENTMWIALFSFAATGSIVLSVAAVVIQLKGDAAV